MSSSQEARRPGGQEGITAGVQVTSQSLLLVLDQGHKLTGITVLYLFFDIKRQSGIEVRLHRDRVALMLSLLQGQLLNFVGSLRLLTKLKISNCCTDQVS